MPGGAPVLIEALSFRLWKSQMWLALAGQDYRPRQIQWQGLRLNLLSPPPSAGGQYGFVVVH